MQMQNLKLNIYLLINDFFQQNVLSAYSLSLFWEWIS